MKSNSKKKNKGVLVKFELLDDNDNIVEVLDERFFPNAEHTDKCFDNEVGEYVFQEHVELDFKYHYSNWEKAPFIRQAFYDVDGNLFHYCDEVEYEMNL